MDTETVTICRACGMPSTTGETHDLGEGDTLELCGRCNDVGEAISGLGWIGHDDDASFAGRRELVGRILTLLDRSDKLCDQRFGDQPSRLAAWFREDEGE